MIITVIEHELSCPLDRFATWLVEPGDVTLRVVRAWAGDLLPRTPEEAGDALVVLGGQAHAYDDAALPWLPATRALLAAAARVGLPTLGLCLGAQLLAVATGGRVQVAAPPGREAGVIDVVPRPAAAQDPLLGGVAIARPADPRARRDGVLAMPSLHADAVVDLPAGALWLASSGQYPYQAFRVGEAAWGLQFHPELSEATFAAIAEMHDDVDAEDVVGQFRTRSADVAEGGRAIALNFVAVVRDRRAAERPVLTLAR